MNSNLIILISIVVIASIILIFAANRKRAAFSLAAKGVFSAGAIWGVNYAIAFLGFALALPGLNLLTVALVAFLGLPGFFMIYGMGIFA